MAARTTQDNDITLYNSQELKNMKAIIEHPYCTTYVPFKLVDIDTELEKRKLLAFNQQN